MTRFFLTICVACMILPSIAHGQSKGWAYVLDHDLNITSIHLDQADSNLGITGTDEQGMPIRFTPGSFFGLWIEHNGMLPPQLSPSDHDQALLVELTDGQRFALVVAPSTDPETLIGTRLDGQRTIQIPLDRIRTISRLRNNPSHAPRLGLFDPLLQDDAIRLDNNDLLVGFITQIGHTVEIEINSPTGQTDLQTYQMDQIHSIQIQNPPVYAPGTYLLTSLHERLRVQAFSSNSSGELTATLDDPILDDPILDDPTLSSQDSLGMIAELASELVAVDPLHEGQYLMDLALERPATITPTGGRSWAPVPELSSSRWVGATRTRAKITSPISMTWTLPKGARRFTMSINSWSRPWTDNRVSIIATDSSGKSLTLWTKHFDSTDAPNEAIGLNLPDRSVKLQLHIDPADNGAIQDQFFVIFPLMLIEGSPEFQ